MGIRPPSILIVTFTSAIPAVCTPYRKIARELGTCPWTNDPPSGSARPVVGLPVEAVEQRSGSTPRQLSSRRIRLFAIQLLQERFECDPQPTAPGDGVRLAAAAVAEPVAVTLEVSRDGRGHSTAGLQLGAHSTTPSCAARSRSLSIRSRSAAYSAHGPGDSRSQPAHRELNAIARCDVTSSRARDHFELRRSALCQSLRAAAVGSSPTWLMSSVGTDAQARLA
jgi:hypothetical protein